MAITRQEKVLKKINKDAPGSNEKLKEAKLAKDDEFYTERRDIELELNHWKNKFVSKRIICPCDWDIFTKDKNKAEVYSLTVEFSDDKEFDLVSPTFYINKIKRIIYQQYKVHYKDGQAAVGIFDDFVSETAVPETIEISGEEAEALLNDRVTCNFLKYLIGIGKAYGIKSITASGYDSDTKRGIPFQSVDYSQYDLCITNPPFSLYKEFMCCMMSEYDKRDRDTNPFDFIILAPFQNRVAPNIAEPLTERKIFFGYGRHLAMAFKNPDKYSNYIEKKIAVDWITTWDDAQKELDKTKIKTGINYELYKEDYKTIDTITCKDGTHPLQLNSVTAIPDDYDGWMLCSVAIFDRLNYTDFEWHIMSLKGFYNKKHPDLNPLQHNVTDAMFNGGFNGQVLFRRKRKENN